MNQRHIYEENKHAEVWLRSLLDEYLTNVRGYERMMPRHAWDEIAFIDCKNKVRALRRAMKVVRREITAYETTVINQN